MCSSRFTDISTHLIYTQHKQCASVRADAPSPRETSSGVTNYEAERHTSNREKGFGRAMPIAMSKRAKKETCKASTPDFCLYSFIAFIILALLSRSITIVTQLRGHLAAPPLPSPLPALVFIARILQHFLLSSTPVDL